MIDLNLCLWMEHELRSYYFILLDQGYIPGIFGVSHGALQFMAYEELKKRQQSIFWNTSQPEAGEYYLHVSV